MFLIQMTIQAATANKSKDASRAGQLLGISIADTNSHKQVFCFQPSPQAGATDDALSPVCIIQFSSSTDSQLYRWQIVCLIALVFIEAVVIAALIIQWRWRKDAENALRRNEELFRAIV
ncbi:MAG TPA: hypothetical protein VEF04_08535, partial [Blastocatellia bacterium]|nr:hypothetical protein [Blastocatellia bacterium]